MSSDATETAEAANDLAPMSNDTKLQMTLKDWIGLAFSTLALLISAASFYNSNYRIDDDTRARVIDVLPDDGNDAITFKVAVANAGNRPSILTDISYVVSTESDKRVNAFGDSAKTAADTIPLSVPAHDVRFIQVRIPNRALLSLYDASSKGADPNAPGVPAGKVYFGLRFESILSSGEAKVSYTPLELEATITKEKVLSFGPADPRKKYAYIRLS